MDFEDETDDKKVQLVLDIQRELTEHFAGRIQGGAWLDILLGSMEFAAHLAGPMDREDQIKLVDFFLRRCLEQHHSWNAFIAQKIRPTA